jgi:hypothetical protein
MVPVSLTMTILFVGFFLSTFAFFFSMPHRPLMDRYGTTMVGTGAVMVLTVTLAIIPVTLVWLSWVMLAIAIASLVLSIQLLRAARVIVRARDRAYAEHIAKGG